MHSTAAAQELVPVKLDQWQPYARGILRIVSGFLFWQHGAQKLFGWFDGRVVESLASLRGVAGIIEVVGGALITIGLLTRPVAFIASGEMAFAYFLRHFDRGFWPINNGGEPAVLFCFIFLYFVFAGSGRFAVDGVLRRRSTREGSTAGRVEV